MATNSTYSPPLARLTPDDHRAPLWVATLICLVFVILGVLTRLYVRFKALGTDDYIIFAAFIVGFAQFMTIIAGLERGLGQSGKVLSDEKLESLGQIFLATEGLFIVGIYVVKASVLSTVERVLGPDDKKRRMMCWILQGVTGICGLASLIAVLVSCDATTLLTAQRNSQCSGQTARWIAVTIIDAITELCTFVLFCLFMSSLQMGASMKSTIIVLLAFRLGCIAFASVHAKYVNSYVDSSNPGIGVVGALVWQQLALAYSLIAALMIALQGFLRSFDMKMGNENTYIHNSRSGGDKYDLKHLSGKGSRFGGRTWDKMSQKDSKAQPSQGDYHNEATAYSTKVYRGENEREPSVRSGISQHPIIRYEVQYQVTHEDKDISRGTSDS